MFKGLIPLLHVSPAEHGQERKGLESSVPTHCTECFRDLQPCQHRSPGYMLQGAECCPLAGQRIVLYRGQSWKTNTVACCAWDGRGLMETCAFPEQDGTQGGKRSCHVLSWPLERGLGRGHQPPHCLSCSQGHAVDLQQPLGCCAWGGQGQKAPGRLRSLQDIKCWSSSHWNLALTCSEPLQLLYPCWVLSIV